VPDPLKRDDLRWENSLANIASAGVRTLVTSKEAALAAATAAAYTIVRSETKRCLVVHNSTANDDIHVTIGETADGADFPVPAGQVFALEVEKGETVNVFNSSGGALDVYFMEIR